MIVVLLLLIGLPVLVLGLRLLFHAVDPRSYGPAGTPGIFEALVDLTAEFGFVVAAAVGATLGASDLGEGVFRQLVITGRSRVSLYLARVPAGLSILLPLVAIGFAMNCLVISYAGTPSPKSVNVNGYSIPGNLSKNGLEAWMEGHPNVAAGALGPGTPGAEGVLRSQPAPSDAYSTYLADQSAQSNPSISQMVKIGLWLELVIGTGLMAGLGLGALTGQRTISTVLMIVLQIIVTPILSMHVIPYFINGQRLIVGVALTQLRPAGLASPNGQGGGPGGHVIFGGRAALGIPPMATWAMVAVIVGWIVGWTVIGAWKMCTRDA